MFVNNPIWIDDIHVFTENRHILVCINLTFYTDASKTENGVSIAIVNFN